MLTLDQTGAGSQKAPESSPECSTPASQPWLRVYMMDLWSFIPYYMARLCASLRKESVNVTLGSVRYHLDRKYFVNSGLSPDPWLIDVGGRLHSHLLRRVVKSAEYLFNLWLLSIRLAFSRPDILHVQYFPFLERGFAFELWFLKWVRFLDIRIVYTVHNVTRQDAPAQGIPLFRRAYHAADALICHGEEARTELVRIMGIAEDKIWLIPHGPLFENPNRLSSQEARQKLNLQCDGPVVLSLGVISQYKGIPFLLDAWKNLKQAGTPGKLVIAGTGDQNVLAEIRQKVAQDELGGSVDLRLEFVPVEQLPLLYQAADILVYPYNAGTTSGALLTGLNYGKAVVATRLPFFLEHLKEGESALLLNYGDIEALASCLQRLIQRPEFRERMGDALARQASQGIGWEEIARKTRACYQARRSAP